MKFPWWVHSSTIQVAVATLILCCIPKVREWIHADYRSIVYFQSIFHIVLRFKTEVRNPKLSEAVR